MEGTPGGDRRVFATSMRVGLNLIYLVPGETGGMEVVARELIPALVAAAPQVHFTAFINREASEEGGRAWGELIPAVTVPVRARNRLEWVRGEQTLLPPLAARSGVDVVHSLASTAPAWGRFRRVVTVHDLIYRFYPETHGGLRAQGMRLLVPLGARRSHRVIADSRSTRDNLVEHLRVPTEKIDVVPLGVGAARSVSAPEPDVRARYDLGERTVVLTVSAKRPHKNLVRLLEAVALIPPEERPVLVLPGYATDHERELRERARSLGVDGDTRFLQWIPSEDLEGLYALATCFVFPSLYEGFGLPVLEAMARGLPVACSDRSALVEVAGDAALRFDPEDPRAIAQALTRLLDDDAERERLRRGGLEQARRFSWTAAARGVLASYERALAGAGASAAERS
ncbi:MAG: glycosyltransferase family 4 protein [Actinomycetota bacterium]|nr:glycosyltransferase family 4 protein [Actinomycetota bacterium]